MNPTHGQRGETLIESIIAITIVTLVAVTAYAGLRTAITSSSENRESAEAETLLRTAAERLQSPALIYVTCADDESYADEMPTADPAYEGDFRIDVQVRYWAPPWQWTTACPDDSGLQEVLLTVTKSSATQPQLELAVLKRRS